MVALELMQLPSQQQIVVQPEREQYQAVKYNAIKHGVLSKLTVLPHEDLEEFEALRDALIEEHQPSGPTEMHLVEDLSAIMWRQRRVLLAENAKINAELRKVVNSPLSSPGKSAVPFGYGMPSKPSDWIGLMDATPEDVLHDQREARHYRELVVQGMDVLRKGGKNAYQKALKTMVSDDRDSWKDAVKDGSYQPTAKGLREYINDQLWPLCVSMEKEAIHHEAIKAQTLGEGLQPALLENLCRYETHLDRKFERTLAMLIKLKELRG